MLEAGELEGDIEEMTGSKETSIYTDYKGHAGDIDRHRSLFGFMQFMERSDDNARVHTMGLIFAVSRDLIDEQNQE